MNRLVVIHPDLRSIGGAEAVCMNILEALQDEYDLHLITYNGANIERLNKSFNTHVKAENLTTHQPWIFRAISSISPNRLSILKDALRTAYLNSSLPEFDLIISTKNELYLDKFTIHYIHNSSYPEYIDPNPETVVRKIYHSLSRDIGGFDEDKLQNDVLLANSHWTAAPLSEYYGVESTVVYPPIDTARFTDQAWADRESGFLCIGQIDPRKNIVENIDIIVKLRNRGHDVHLHILGPINSQDYYRRVTDEADKYDFIHVEGEVSFERMTKMICSHKYGIHGMLKEHFGMVIAEMVSGGMIPFVPNGGGQVEIVNKNEALIYGSSADAVEKINDVLSNTEVQRELRSELQKMKMAFTKDRFQQEIRDVVRKTIDTPKFDHG